MSDNTKKYNAAQLRLLLVIEILSGNEVFGMRLKDVVESLTKSGIKVSTATVLHDLEALQKGGWAQQMEDTKWRLDVKPIQVLTNFQFGLSSSGNKVNEVQQRYTRLPS